MLSFFFHNIFPLIGDTDTSSPDNVTNNNWSPINIGGDWTLPILSVLPELKVHNLVKFLILFLFICSPKKNRVEYELPALVFQSKFWLASAKALLNIINETKTNKKKFYRN